MVAKTRSPAQLANDERLRQKAADRATTNAAQREAGQSPAVFAQATAVGPDDAKAEVIQVTNISTEGEATSSTSFIDQIDPAQALHLIEDEKFMNEKVLIEVEPGEGEGAPLFIPSGHNGITQWIKVGEKVAVKRRFLYSLLCAKSARLSSDFGKDAAGREFNRLDGPKRSTHRVFVYDDTARGREKYKEWSQMT